MPWYDNNSSGRKGEWKQCVTRVTRQMETKTKRSAKLACRITRRSRAKRFSSLTSPFLFSRSFSGLWFFLSHDGCYVIPQNGGKRRENGGTQRVQIAAIRLIMSITLQARCQISRAWTKSRSDRWKINFLGRRIAPGSKIREDIDNSKEES